MSAVKQFFRHCACLLYNTVTMIYWWDGMLQVMGSFFQFSSCKLTLVPSVYGMLFHPSLQAFLRVGLLFFTFCKLWSCLLVCEASQWLASCGKPSVFRCVLDVADCREEVFLHQAKHSSSSFDVPKLNFVSLKVQKGERLHWLDHSPDLNTA